MRKVLIANRGDIAVRVARACRDAEQPLDAHRAGTVRSLAVAAGASLAPGAVVCEISD